MWLNVSCHHFWSLKWPSVIFHALSKIISCQSSTWGQHCFGIVSRMGWISDWQTWVTSNGIHEISEIYGMGIMICDDNKLVHIWPQMVCLWTVWMYFIPCQAKHYALCVSNSIYNMDAKSTWEAIRFYSINRYAKCPGMISVASESDFIQTISWMGKNYNCDWNYAEFILTEYN